MTLGVLAAASGCMGPNDETLVDELRVMAIVAEPPEAAPGATVTLTTHVADPLDEAPTAMVWTCASLGDGCLEAAEPGQGTTVAEPEGGTVVTQRVATPAFGVAVADGETVIPVATWALACAPDRCDAIALAEAEPAAGSADAEALSAFLADPYGGMEDVPLEGTSLALSLLAVSMRAEPVRNPLLTPASDEAVTATAGGSVDLVFAVESDDVTTAYGYTTAGGFDATEYPVEDGEVTLTWFAPEQAGEAALWVVVNGEEGGSAVWSASARAE